MKSMTGYGKSEKSSNGIKLTVEIKSVNNRFLDINIKQPYFLLEYEDIIRNIIKNSLNRGRIDIYIRYSSESENTNITSINWPLITAYLDAATSIAKNKEIENDITVTSLLKFPDVLTIDNNKNESDTIKLLLTNAVKDAVFELQCVRETEGKILAADIANRLKLLGDTISRIEKIEPEIINEYKNKLYERLNDALNNNMIDDIRLMQEIVIYADKSNITEEIVRVKSHLTQFINLMSKHGQIGKNMDFLLQELNREFNTISSKAQNIDIISDVINAKGEIEKIREQIQNVE